MRIATGIILLLFAALLQVTLMMRMTLLQGPADLVLLVMIAWMLQPGNRPSWLWGLPAGLMIGYASALPDYVPLMGYVVAAGLCQLLQTRIWQVPLFTLFSATLLGTLVIHLVSVIYLWLSSNPIDPLQAFNLITIPSILLNLILVLPINALIGEVNKLLNPELEPA
jgi:cell shape-determining protein MreD